MKHIKPYKIFENIKGNSEIIKKLRRYSIDNYTINEDSTIDVDGDADLSNDNLTKIPFRFGKVSGDFICGSNSLTSLEGCPKEVGGGFYCPINLLHSLIGGPQEVGGDYLCGYNNLETLEGCAGDIGGDLHCYHNKLTSLDCSSVVNGDIYCHGNNFDVEPDFYGVCNNIYWIDDSNDNEYEHFNESLKTKTNEIVLIHYWYNNMITPVEILEKVGNKYLISHNIELSKIKNAPNQLISKSEIIDKYRK